MGWELPGGIVEGDEDSATTAAREVEVETGWRPHVPLQKLLEFQPMPGMVDTPHELFLAHRADKIGEPPTPRKPASCRGYRWPRCRR
ncbi:NUDIX hydrolase [Flindersiella endophytica]